MHLSQTDPSTLKNVEMACALNQLALVFANVFSRAIFSVFNGMCMFCFKVKVHLQVVAIRQSVKLCSFGTTGMSYL